MRRESRAAEINPKIHWVAKDPLFAERVKQSVADNSTRYYYLVPDDERVLRGMREAIGGIEKALDAPSRSKVKSVLKYVPVRPGFFQDMPFSVVIYNAMSAPRTAILLEPMAESIGTDHFDSELSGAELSQADEPHRCRQAHSTCASAAAT